MKVLQTSVYTNLNSWMQERSKKKKITIKKKIHKFKLRINSKETKVFAT